jgi:hypothetical protein
MKYVEVTVIINLPEEDVDKEAVRDETAKELALLLLRLAQDVRKAKLDLESIDWTVI